MIVKREEMVESAWKIEEVSHCHTESVCSLGKLDFEKTHPVTRTHVKINN